MNIVAEAKHELAPSVEGKALPNNPITIEHQPVKIKNNTRVQVDYIDTRGKCQRHVPKSCGKTSNVTSLDGLLPSANFVIIINFDKGQFNLDVQPNDTIKEVKSKIESKEGISSAEQWLYYDGRHLRDDQTLTSWKVEHESSVELVIALPGEYQVFVQNIYGQIRVLDGMNYEITVTEFKKKVAKCEGIRPEIQRLIFRNSVLEDCWTLADYGICSGSTVILTLKLRGCNQPRDPLMMNIEYLTKSRRSTGCSCIVL